MAISWASRLVRVVVTFAALAVLALAVLNKHWGNVVAVGALILICLILRRKTKPVQLVFELGQHEKHQVNLWFDKFWGDLCITVDGKPVVRDQRLFSVKSTKTYILEVGDRKLHNVRIEKDRTLLLAGARAQPIRAYVDDVLTAEAVA